MNILHHILRRPAAPEPDAALPPAAHLVGDRHRPISFADVVALPEPEWATTPALQPFQPGRYEWEALVPAGQLATVPLDDDLITRLDAIAAVWFDAQFEDDEDRDAESEAS